MGTPQTGSSGSGTAGKTPTPGKAQDGAKKGDNVVTNRSDNMNRANDRSGGPDGMQHSGSAQNQTEPDRAHDTRQAGDSTPRTGK